jgi:hypothetical protein
MTDDHAESLSRAFDDPALDTAMWALVRGEVEPAVDLLGATRADPERREVHIEVLGEAGERRLTELREHAERDRGDADRWLLLGSALSDAAWSARGSAVAAQTSEEQIGGLVRLTRQARSALRRAVDLAPDDAVSWSVLLGCAHGVPERDGEQQELFKAATDRFPLLYGAHVTMLTTLTRKWYGSQRQVLDFARERTTPLPDGHPLHALTAHAHIEGYVDAMMADNMLRRIWRVMRYFSNPEVRADIDAGADRLLASDQFAGHPRYIAAHQAYAVVYHQAADETRSAPHLARSGEHPAQWPWGYFGDPKTEFAKARKAAGMVR